MPVIKQAGYGGFSQTLAGVMAQKRRDVTARRQTEAEARDRAERAATRQAEEERRKEEQQANFEQQIQLADLLQRRQEQAEKARLGLEENKATQRQKLEEAKATWVKERQTEVRKQQDDAAMERLKAVQDRMDARQTNQIASTEDLAAARDTWQRDRFALEQMRRELEFSESLALKERYLLAKERHDKEGERLRQAEIDLKAQVGTRGETRRTVMDILTQNRKNGKTPATGRDERLLEEALAEGSAEKARQIQWKEYKPADKRGFFENLWEAMPKPPQSKTNAPSPPATPTSPTAPTATSQGDATQQLLILTQLIKENQEKQASIRDQEEGRAGFLSRPRSAKAGAAALRNLAVLREQYAELMAEYTRLQRQAGKK